jgi:hypothetical protein
MNRIMGSTPLLALFAVTLTATAARGEAAVNADAGISFRLERPAAIDDVFGDSSDYRRTVDRFLELTNHMQLMRDEFARAVQTALSELNGRVVPKGKHVCPVDQVATPYARARQMGADYLRTGRELTRHWEVVREYDRLGESIGLTPDYRWKVRRVLQQYQALLTDYREMKVALHDQLDDELKYAGCDLNGLAQKGDPKLELDDPWPQPGHPGAPGVLAAKTEKDHETIPSSLPSEKVVQTPIPFPPKKVTAPADHFESGGAQPRSGILFYVDNAKCQRATAVWLDGKKLGEVPAATRAGFQTAPGPHDLCLLDDAAKKCGAPGTVRKSYLSEGWTITLRCE